MGYRITILNMTTAARYEQVSDKKLALQLAKRFCTDLKSQVWVEQEGGLDCYGNLKLIADYVYLDGKARRM